MFVPHRQDVHPPHNKNMLSSPHLCVVFDTDTHIDIVLYIYVDVSPPFIIRLFAPPKKRILPPPHLDNNFTSPLDKDFAPLPPPQGKGCEN